MYDSIYSNLHSNEYNEGLRCYPFTVNLDRYMGINDLFNRICVPNKAEDLNLSLFNIITEINESKTLTKHISCKGKCKFNSRKCSSNQKWNNDKCWCECKNPKKHHAYEKNYIWNPATCSFENGE